MAILTKTPPYAPLADAAEEALEDARRTVKRAIADVEHTADEMAETTTRAVRREPLKALGWMACAGTFTGVLIGFALGWYVKPRR
jgi:ElaB/YqjD/DUF883 family membrane-anchored ribosome-binding protein